MRPQFGKILLERGRIDTDSLQRALRQQDAEPRTRLGELLLRGGLISTFDIAQTLASQFGLPMVASTDYPEFPVLEEQVSTRFLRETRTLPVEEDAETVTVAMADPKDTYASMPFGC